MLSGADSSGKEDVERANNGEKRMRVGSGSEEGLPLR